MINRQILTEPQIIGFNDNLGITFLFFFINVVAPQ